MDIMFRSDDGSLPQDDIMIEWSKRFQNIGDDITGKTFRIAEKCRGFIEGAGFVNVVEKKYKIPVGSWSSDPLMKELGRWNMMHCFTGAENWALHLLTKVMGVRASLSMIFLTAAVDSGCDAPVHPPIPGQPAEPDTPRLL
jgi:hypothetical protein